MIPLSEFAGDKYEEGLITTCLHTESQKADREINWPSVTQLANDMARTRTRIQDFRLNDTKFPESKARAEHFQAQITLAAADLSSASLILISASVSSTSSQQSIVRISGNKSFRDRADGGSQLDSEADVRPPRLQPSVPILPPFWLDGHLGKICALKLSPSRGAWNPPGRSLYVPCSRALGGAVTLLCPVMWGDPPSHLLLRNSSYLGSLGSP